MFDFQAPQSLHCGVCLQVVRRDSLLALPCQHSFCKACWEQHCTVLVKDGMGVGEWRAYRRSIKLHLFWDGVSVLHYFKWKWTQFFFLAKAPETSEHNSIQRWLPYWSIMQFQWCNTLSLMCVKYPPGVKYTGRHASTFKCVFVCESAWEG